MSAARPILLGFLLLIAALQMAHFRLWPLTTHGADFACPAWLYLESLRGKTFLRFLGLRPEKPLRLALGLLLLCALWELGQFYRFIPGTFDFYDFLAYFLGVASAYVWGRAF